MIARNGSQIPINIIAVYDAQIMRPLGNLPLNFTVTGLFFGNITKENKHTIGHPMQSLAQF